MQPARKIAYLPLAEIVPAVRNVKNHDLDALIRSISRFGYGEPVLRDERTGKLVAGHGRLEALAAMQAAGEDAPDGVRVVGGRWEVPVVTGWRSRSDAEAEAYLVASNRLSEKGGWDDRGLADLLVELTRVDDSLVADAGWSATELNELIAGLDAGADVTPPTEFPSYDDDLATDHTCPKCGYEFS